jgi:iron-sulfur cluster assembly protein
MMSNQDGARIVGLGAPKAQEAAQPSGGVVGLGVPKAEQGSSGVVGLGSKPAPPAEAPAQPAPAKPRGGIGIEESAADRIRKLLGDRGTPEAGLRIRVRGGGCTGMQYDMEFADAAREKDRVFEEHGVRVFVDPKSYIFLIGTVLQYKSGLLESGFKLENPNVKKACGCGESFSV